MRADHDAVACTFVLQNYKVLYATNFRKLQFFSVRKF